MTKKWIKTLFELPDFRKMDKERQKQFEDKLMKLDACVVKEDNGSRYFCSVKVYAPTYKDCAVKTKDTANCVREFFGKARVYLEFRGKTFI